MDTNLRPARVPLPGSIIREELDARGWTQKDLARIMGRPEKTISQIVNGHKQITPETALELAAAFGTSAELWLNLEARYRLREAEGEHGTSEIERKGQLYDKLPISEMQKRGWIDEHDEVDDLERDVRSFLGVAQLAEHPRVLAVLRQSAVRVPEVGAEVAWARRVEQLASAQQVGSFDRQRLAEAIPALAHLSAEPEGVAEVPAFLARLGVHFVIVPHLERTYLDGAALWINDRPIVALTLRYDRVDNFWFTLLHELAHVVAGHEGGYLDDLDQEPETPQEIEANRMAQDWLLDPEALADFVSATRPYFSERRIRTFAADQHRHPGIVVGRLHHGGHTDYGHLRKLQVKIGRYLEAWVDTAGL
jgi:HTH-type transcriptional regulator/antitoxin HigA